MSASETAKLYSPELLALAVELAGFPYDPVIGQAGQARSRTCGSVVDLVVALDPTGAITDIGIRASACAVGQAAAAIFAKGATGADAALVDRALAQIDDWLAGGETPDWPGFSVLEPARAHKGRHGALALPWRAAQSALSNPATSG